MVFALGTVEREFDGRVGYAPFIAPPVSCLATVLAFDTLSAIEPLQ